MTSDYTFSLVASNRSPEVHALVIVGNGVEYGFDTDRGGLLQLKGVLDSYLDGIIVCGNCGQFKRSHPDAGCAWPFFTPTNDPDPEGAFARAQLSAGLALVSVDPKVIHDHGDGSYWIVDGPVPLHVFGTPGTGSTLEPAPMAHADIIDAANNVIDSWATGDLAGAVNAMREALEERGLRTPDDEDSEA